MKSIKVTIAGRSYPLKVEDHDVEMMLNLARQVDHRINQFKNALATQPESTVMVMACLSFAEELHQMKQASKNASLSSEIMEDIKTDLSSLLEMSKSS